MRSPAPSLPNTTAGKRWAFSTTFDYEAGAGAEGGAAATLLVFEGIKMGATIVLNGVVLGNTTDQFVRYEYPVTHALLTTATNKLEVRQPPSLPISNGFFRRAARPTVARRCQSPRLARLHYDQPAWVTMTLVWRK